ncbi:MAG: diacylglycerol kinase family lipid kinase [Prevotella sp.]|nr:diacylglycerol kinase family lipid kinase [Prevotella sp.]
MSKQTAIFIINPRSGVARKSDIPRLIDKYLDREKFIHSVCFTQYAGHAETIAAQARDEGIDMVVAVGGDGTVNEVARSIINTPVVLGIVPCGSGNGLARHLLLPINVRKCIKILNAYEVHRLDYGSINNHPFFCTCGVGFDALISREFATSSRRGPIAYAENILREALNYKPETYEIITAGKTATYKAMLISIANASQYGNNVYIAPQASMSDGMLDVIIIEPLDFVEASQVSIEMFNKTVNQNAKIKTFRTKDLRIRRETDGVIHFDGDPAEAGREIHVRIHEKGINIVVNPEADKSLRRPNAMQSATAQLFNNINFLRQNLQNRIKQIRPID